MGSSKKLIEAALFMSPKPLSLEDLGQIAKVPNLNFLEKDIQEIMQDYEQRDTALEITKIGSSYQMGIKPEFEESVTHLASESQFHKGVMKTLAMISFKQPVKQSFIIKYRNNKAYDHIHQLEEKGFINREKSGRTYVLKTTRKFLEYFGAGKKKE